MPITYTNAWSASTPANSDKHKFGAHEIRTDKLSVKERLNAIVAYDIPIGALIPFAGGTVPTQTNPTTERIWLPCDGTNYSTTGIYAALFAVIGTAYGASGGAGTFNVPDLRGRFLRGLDAGGTIDADVATRTALAVGGNTGALVGAEQLAGVKDHGHYYNISGTNMPNFSMLVRKHGPDTQAYTSYDIQEPLAAGTSYIGGISTASTIGADTRPRNVAVNYMIKAAAISLA